MGLKALMRAESIIQREAVISALAAQGINAFSEERDISRKIADSTVDLAYEGYSALFDGFTIHVDESDFERAQPIAESVLRAALAAPADKGLEEGSSMRKFYFCCLFSLMFPVLFHGLALYHFVRGLQRGERPHPVYGVFALLLFVLSGGLVLYLFTSTDWLAALASFAEKL